MARRARRATPGSAPKSDATPTPTVERSSAPCPRCTGTEHEVIKKLGEQVYAGTHQGRPYTSIVRRRVRCRNCAQVFITLERPFEPGRWPETAADAAPEPS